MFSSFGQGSRATLGGTAARTFRSLRVRNYRLFFFGQLVSVSGTWMQTVAQSWLVLTLTGSGLDLGITVAMQFLPMLIFGMWGGLVADRFDKRRVLLAAQGVAAALALTMWALVITGVVELWMVYVLAFLLGMVQVVDLPTRHAFVTEMVGPDEVPNAVGLNSAMFNAGRLLGPAAGGLLISTAGVAVAFLVNAGSYLAVIAALWAMRPEDLYRERRTSGRQRGQIREGLRYVWATPPLRSTLLLVAVVATFGFNFPVVLPLLARYTFDGGAPLYGLLTGVMAFGSLLGALFAAGRPRLTRGALVGSGAVFGALTILAAAAPTSLAAAAVLAAAGVAVMLFIATANTTLQLNSSPAMRGRVMALYGLVFLGTTPVGGPLLGLVSGHWGARAGLVFSGAMSLAAAVAAAAAPALRRRRRRQRLAAAAHPSAGWCSSPGNTSTSEGCHTGWSPDVSTLNP